MAEHNDYARWMLAVIIKKHVNGRGVISEPAIDWDAITEAYNDKAIHLSEDESATKDEIIAIWNKMKWEPWIREIDEDHEFPPFAHKKFNIDWERLDQLKVPPRPDIEGVLVSSPADFIDSPFERLLEMTKAGEKDVLTVSAAVAVQELLRNKMKFHIASKWFRINKYCIDEDDEETVALKTLLTERQTNDKGAMSLGEFLDLVGINIVGDHINFTYLLSRITHQNILYNPGKLLDEFFRYLKLVDKSNLQEGQHACTRASTEEIFEVLQAHKFNLDNALTFINEEPCLRWWGSVYDHAGNFPVSEKLHGEIDNQSESAHRREVEGQHSSTMKKLRQLSRDRKEYVDNKIRSLVLSTPLHETQAIIDFATDHMNEYLDEHSLRNHQHGVPHMDISAKDRIVIPKFKWNFVSDENRTPKKGRFANKKPDHEWLQESLAVLRDVPKSTASNDALEAARALLDLQFKGALLPFSF